MKISELQNRLNNIQKKLHSIIRKRGLKGKQSYIRSSKLIFEIHEVVKISLKEELEKHYKNTEFAILPPIGKNSPELTMEGYLKNKKQDIVVLFRNYDIEKSIVIGVRSQLSSLNKNFDTLMERTFAETLNLRLRNSELIMGEVYLIPAKEYNEKAMEDFKVEFKKTNLDKFIQMFDRLSNRVSIPPLNPYEIFKYNSTALIISDFSQKHGVKLYTNGKELLKDGLISSQEIAKKFDKLSPIKFTERLIKHHSYILPKNS
ncbi:hypothetical protein [Campylobacter sp. RKI_CA19_01116]|uniref:hypothetical protein n=1 Tax=Campylobacter sp. RKI_CA19_01116 TaxID=2911625 RepID=UPI0021E90BCF|nr:hypothetical protein [Campylobacter sp. RKI_CA19_01116]MCV3397626.1 hypothetical protein [Campylobacter sp. RKI_CA19_01116]